VPSPLTALMSAGMSGSSSEAGVTVWRFSQEIPIPSYLIALVVGSLESRCNSGYG